MEKQRFVRAGNPLEQPRWGEEYVSPHMRFQPGDVDRFWMVNVMHCPQPIYPLEIDSIMSATCYGVDWAVNPRFSIPNSYGNDYRILNGRLYFSAKQVTDPHEIEQRHVKSQERLAKFLANWDDLWRERERQIEEYNQWLEGFDYENCPNLNDALQMQRLRDDFEHMMSMMYRVGEWHLEFTIAYTTQLIMHRSLCNELVPEIHDDEMTKTLQGFGTKLMETDVAFWKMGKLARTLGVFDIVKNVPIAEMMSRLEAKENGRKWLEELRKTTHRFGMRHTGAINISSVSWIEDLTYPISFIQGLLEKIEKDEELVPQEALGEERNRAIKAFEKRIETVEGKKRFRESLRFMQRLYPWYEDHNFLIEGKFFTLVHLKMVELGRRFVNEGYFDDPYDINFLTVNELRTLLLEVLMKNVMSRAHNKMDVRTLVRDRQEIRRKQLDWQYPAVLGLMPAEPPTDPVAVLIYGANPENIRRLMEEAESLEAVTVIDGIATSAGVCEGKARVLKDVSQLKEVKCGEILVCAGTNPMWNTVFPTIAGVVTDTGGVLSHAGIIAREYNIPCVVGTGYGTKLIKSGDRIRVDGNKGIVTRIQPLE